MAAKYVDCEVCGCSVAASAVEAHGDDHGQHLQCLLDQCQHNPEELAREILSQTRSILVDDSVCAWSDDGTDYSPEVPDWIIEECETALSDAEYLVYSDGNSWIVYTAPDCVCQDCGRCYYSGEVVPEYAVKTGWKCACGADADSLN